MAGSFLRLVVADEGQRAGDAVHDVARNVDIFRHERMVDDDIDGFGDGFFHRLKTSEPALEFDAQ